MKTILLLHCNENSIGSLRSLEIPVGNKRAISEICLVVDMNGYLPISYPKKWKIIPIKVFECTKDSYKNVVDYLIHVETVYFTSNFSAFLIPILRSLPNVYGFTIYGEITIHEIFYDLYIILSKYFSETRQKSIKTYKAKDSINIYNRIQDISKNQWNLYQFFEIDSDNNDLIDIFIKRLQPKVNSIFEEINWQNALISVWGNKNFNFFYLEDQLNKLAQQPQTFIFKNFDKISEPYKTQIISVIQKHLKPEQKVILFRESLETDTPFPAFKISLPKLSRIKKTDWEIKLFVFLILEAELDGQKRELMIQANLDLANNILVASELLSYDPNVIISAIKKILTLNSTTTINLSSYDFWYELFNNLPEKNRLILKNLFHNHLLEEKNEEPILAPTKKEAYIEYPNRIERKGKVVKLYFNNKDLDFIGSNMVGWKYLEFLIINSNNGIKYSPLQLFNLINREKKKRLDVSLKSNLKKNDTIQDDEKTIQFIDVRTLKESLERLKNLEKLEDSFEIDDEQLEKIKKEKDMIQEFLNENSRLVKDENGKLKRIPKKTETQQSKAKRTIKQNLERVINPLKDHFPEAYEHFSLYLKKESYFQYDPPKEFNWKY